jgi:hypothetical protein
VHQEAIPEEMQSSASCNPADNADLDGDDLICLKVAAYRRRLSTLVEMVTRVPRGKDMHTDTDPQMDTNYMCR